MNVITTVCGDIQPNELGFTTMHEHTLFDMSEMQQAVKSTLPPVPAEKTEIKLENMNFLLDAGSLYNDEFYHNTSYEATLFELRQFAALGGRGLVDASPCFTREDVKAVRRLSEESGVKIVCATGFAPNHNPIECAPLSEDQMYEICMDEIANGIDGTGIRPGIVKTMITRPGDAEGGYDAMELRSLRATGRAAADSGYLIQVHKNPGVTDDMVVNAAKMLLDMGVRPEKVQMLHQDQTMFMPLEPYARGLVTREGSYELAERLFDLGVNVSFDTWAERTSSLGIVKSDDSDRLRMLIHFIEAGRADQIVLGHDCIMRMFGVAVGGFGLTRIHNFVVANLLSYGYTQELVDKLTVENPARLLSH